MQWKLEASDLAVVLALVRAGTLAGAGERLGIDGSTVFRSLQRMEKALGQRLFDRSRSGYAPSELGQALARHGELVEAQLEAARSETQSAPSEVTGSVRITSTDTILHGLVAPALGELRATHPGLTFDLHIGNELASLTKRDADIAARATRRPPGHLIGKRIGPIRVALYGAKTGGPSHFDAQVASSTAWIAPDDAMPEHPSVTWRRKHFPKVSPTFKVDSILTVAELIGRGAGIGLVPVFLARVRSDLAPLTDPIEECETDLWLLTHPEARHLRRVSATYAFLGEHLSLT